MVIVLMGVSGAGKTTVGRKLAWALGWRFFDADALHSASNREKMHRGEPLTDADRRPWLKRVRTLVEKCLDEGTGAVVACSALKQSYRDVIVADPARVRIVYLKGSPELVARRIAKRRGHFMPASLLPSQFRTLEEPRDALAVDIAQPPERIVAAIRAGLKL
jgi:gluconokinase